jgi:subtilisin family serine protease
MNHGSMFPRTANFIQRMKANISALLLGCVSLLLTVGAAAAADRAIGHLPNGDSYIKDEVEFCVKAEAARALSRADFLRQRVDTSRLAALHPAIVTVTGNHLSAQRWLNGEALPPALKHTGADVPVIARSLTATLSAGADAAVVVEELRKHPDVEWASLNLLHPVTYIPNDALWTNQWGPSRILATNGWDVPQASTALRVAVIDTGVDLTHPDLAPRIVYQKGFAGNPTGDAMRDVRGGSSIDHGTHVAGIAAAIRDNSIGIAGVANVGIMAMGCAVWGTNSAGVALYQIGSANVAINDAVANGATVINCSFGQAAPLNPGMQSALDNAQSIGVVVVCAAGNDGTNIVNSPSAGWAAHPWPIIVSNIQQTTNDTPSPSSNFGGRINLAAPGTGILSTFTTNYTAPAPGGSYGTMSGTSQASPHVAGAAAMVRSMNPARIYAPGTRDLLYRMAQDLGAPGVDPVYGFGMLQLPAPFLSVLKNGDTFVGLNSAPWTPDGSYDRPYPTLSGAMAVTPSGGTLVLNGGATGVPPPIYPAQPFSSPITLTAFPDRPVTIGN